MPAPIAQLGYMPNINAPSVSGQPRQNPWMALAQQVLGAAAEGAIKNELTADVTDQAKAQNLGPKDAQKAGFWSKMLNGPTTSREQLDRMQSEAGQNTRLTTSEAGATARNEATNRAAGDRQHESDVIALQGQDNDKAYHDATIKQNQEQLKYNKRKDRDELQAKVNKQYADEDLERTKIDNERIQNDARNAIMREGIDAATAEHIVPLVIQDYKGDMDTYVSFAQQHDAKVKNPNSPPDMNRSFQRVKSVLAAMKERGTPQMGQRQQSPFNMVPSMFAPQPNAFKIQQ